jgi:glycosyltransferase involved in cell wall biosynthesis
MMPTLHMLGLAHLPSIEASPVWACAYTQKMVKLARMMKGQGYPVIYYGVEGSQVDCSEFVQVLDEKARGDQYGPIEAFASEHFKYGPHDYPYQVFIKNAISEIKDRLVPGDILINPMGNYYAEICQPVKSGGVEVANGIPFLVEGGIGYTGILKHTHKVFESNTWRSFIYGKYGIEDIDFYDTVIPNFFDPAHYKYSDQKEEYFLMVCRQATRKGIHIAVQTVEAIGGKLLLAGQPGEVTINSPNVEYLGYIDEKEKIDLLSHAKALFQPTLYNPPFEGVTIEAMMSGTPVITTDHGCFTETVPNGVVGYRCNTLKEFVKAANQIDQIRHKTCRDRAELFYSCDACSIKYDEYFRRLGDLFKKGWGELN